MKTLTLTTAQIYRRKQRLWKAYCQTAESVRRAFFPDTAGVSLYLHNWYKCGKDAKKAALAEWIDDSTYARYKRLEARLCADNVEREHKFGDHGKRFDPRLTRCGARFAIHTRQSLMDWKSVMANG